MARSLKILTFNHHESFLTAMAPLGHDFDVVVRRSHLALNWNHTARKPPPHFRLIDFAEAQEKLKRQEYDLIICHTIKNLVWLWGVYGTPTVFVAHIPLYWHTPFHAIKSLFKWMVLAAFRLFGHRCECVAVSEWKKKTWGFKGDVVKFFPIPFPEEVSIPPKNPERQFQLPVVVGNGLRSRGDELGWPLLEPLVREFPIRLIGKNPDIPQAMIPQSFPEFVRGFAEGDFYVYTISQPHGDGYNTSMLEAMLLGMPVVTIDNPSSPIIHGKNGLVGKTLEELSAHMHTLMADRNLCERLGREAQKTVTQEFTQAGFLSEWQRVIARVTGQDLSLG